VALQKRASRRIVVDGVTYRWQVRARTDCPFCSGSDTHGYVVQDERTNGTLLVVTSPTHRAITPATVASAVRTALASGWTSTLRAEPHYFNQSLSPGDQDRPDLP
jgi:hypothetical protein